MSVYLSIAWCSALGLSELECLSAVCLLDARDRIEEVAEGELDELDAAALRLVAPDKGWVARLGQYLVLTARWLGPCCRWVACIGRG